MNILAQQTGMTRSDFLARYVRGSEPVVPLPACDIEPHSANPAWSATRFPPGQTFNDSQLCDVAFTGGVCWADNVWRMRVERGIAEPMVATIGHDCTSFAFPSELAPYAPWGPTISEYIEQHDKQAYRNGPLANCLWSFALSARATGRHPTHLHGMYEPAVFAGGLPADDPRWLIAEALCQKPPRYFPTICKGAEGYARLRAINMEATTAFNDYIRDWESRGVRAAMNASGLSTTTWSKEYTQKVRGKQIPSPWPTHFAPGQTLPDGVTSHLYPVADTPEWRETYTRAFKQVYAPIVLHLNLSVENGVPVCPLDWYCQQAVANANKIAYVILFYPPKYGADPVHEAHYQSALSALGLVKE